ncbi:hypothetical protein PGT21_023097 [Puccinia graminis f. sp. tritici]|uniref:Uncharacterized protein n=1 Tax=Puccinia graminis f. sp. tritici TaxID=56615 RepID=A0A5B0QJ18_PUCGR|nr:hypothetical protein PGT21_023097 [Puccinia graminis f. sp. tritici]
MSQEAQALLVPRNPSVPSGIRGSWACSEGPTTIRRTKTNDPARSDKKRKKNDLLGGLRGSWGVLRGLG